METPIDRAEPDRRKPKSRLGRAALWTLAVLIFIIIFSKYPPLEVLAAAEAADPIIIIAVLSTFSLFTLFFDSYTHLQLFRRFSIPIGYKEALILRGQTYLLLSLGFLYGQGGMAYLASKKAGKPISEVTGAIGFLMFCNLQALLIFPALALPFLTGAKGEAFRNSSEYKFVIRWLLIIWPLIILQVAFFIRDWDFGLRRRLKGGVFSAFDRARLQDYAALTILRAAQMAAWTVGTFWGMRAFNLDIPLADLFIRGPFVMLIGVIPTPGRLGTTQGAMVLLFSDLADGSALVAFSLAWNLAVSFTRWLIGAAFFAYGNISASAE